MDTKMCVISAVIVGILYGTLCSCAAQDTFYFNLKPGDQAVVEGTELTLLCDVSNRRHIQFQWNHNGKPITNTSRRFQDGSNLRILRVTREDDAGTFQCIATNVTTGFSLQSAEASLDIQWIDSVAVVELKRIKDENVTLGADLQLKCTASGNTEPTYYWYLNQFRIFNKDNIKIVDKGTRLKINSITASDNGIYSCRAENLAGTVDSSTNYLLNIEAPNTPHLIQDLFTPYKLVQKNGDARLDCPFVNATKIEWFANYEKLSNSSRHTVYNNGSLYFPKVRKADEAGYRCEGLSSLPDIPAQTFTAELVLSYMDDLDVNSFEPRLIPNFPLVIPVHLQFIVKAFLPEGKPKPAFKWLNKNDMLIGDTGPIRTVGSNLFFEDPQQVDSGNYTFIVNNSAGEKLQSVWIIVSVPPIIRKGPQTQQVAEGDDVEFSCQITATAYPVTTILWHKDNEYLKLGSSRHYVNKETGNLRISMVTDDDDGEYICIANTTGQKLVQSPPARLRVKKKLKFNPEPQNTYLELGSNSKVHCNADADIIPKVHWMKGSWQNVGKMELKPHIIDEDGTLHFHGVQRDDEGPYTCVAQALKEVTSELINKTIQIFVVERPKFQIRPINLTAYEEHSIMLHCVASGDPRPAIIWDKNQVRDNWDRDRVTFFANGTMMVTKVYMEDQGLYGCTANNSAGVIYASAFVYVATGSEYADLNARGNPEGFDMMRTVLIAVCSAGAYLALVIGLTAYCSYRLLVQRRIRKNMLNDVEKAKGNLSQEQHELLTKDQDHDSGNTHGCHSDSDIRSHVSALNYHPSHLLHTNSQMQSQNISNQSQQNVRKTSVDLLYFPRQELLTIGMLGKSQYGDVFLAKARGIHAGEMETQVVVKSLLSKEDSYYCDFQGEVEMYSKLNHNNIIKLLGVCREAEPFFYIAEYCDWGDLKQFLLASRVDSNVRCRIPPLTTLQKIGMCNQVALGMEHLSNKGFVHKDLACRNVLLTSRLELKISHLSLARSVYANEYVIMNNQTALPLRWLSPEAALEVNYSTKSDVWMYGIFMWEVMHLAEIPYKNCSDHELLTALKSGNMTLEFSEQCQSEMVDIVRKCTLINPSDRPSFMDICNFVAEHVDIYSQPQFQSPPAQSLASLPSLTFYTAPGAYTT